MGWKLLPLDCDSLIWGDAKFASGRDDRHFEKEGTILCAASDKLKQLPFHECELRLK